MRLGFIGLGNVGGKLASSVLRDGFELMVHDLQRSAAGPLLEGGAKWGENGAEVARHGGLVITCLPPPQASAEALEGGGGVLTGLSADKIWLEMSSSDHQEVLRLGGGASECTWGRRTGLSRFRRMSQGGNG